MTERASSFARKLLAGVVLAVAAWVLLRVVINVVAAVAWIAAAVLAVIAVVWAVNALRSD